MRINMSRDDIIPHVCSFTISCWHLWLSYELSANNEFFQCFSISYQILKYAGAITLEPLRTLSWLIETLICRSALVFQYSASVKSEREMPVLSLLAINLEDLVCEMAYAYA